LTSIDYLLNFKSLLFKVQKPIFRWAEPLFSSSKAGLAPFRSLLSHESLKGKCRGFW